MRTSLTGSRPSQPKFARRLLCRDCHVVGSKRDSLPTRQLKWSSVSSCSRSINSTYATSHSSLSSNVVPTLFAKFDEICETVEISTPETNEASRPINSSRIILKCWSVFKHEEDSIQLHVYTFTLSLLVATVSIRCHCLYSLSLFHCHTCHRYQFRDRHMYPRRVHTFLIYYSLHTQSTFPRSHLQFEIWTFIFIFILESETRGAICVENRIAEKFAIDSFINSVHG